MKSAKRTCAWCETAGPAGINCVHCLAPFPQHRYEDLPRPAAPDRYTEQERAAYSQLDVLTAMEGSR